VHPQNTPQLKQCLCNDTIFTMLKRGKSWRSDAEAPCILITDTVRNQRYFVLHSFYQHRWWATE